MKALTFHEFGGSDVLRFEDVPTPTISEQEVLIEMKAIGLNFADIYRRKGNYHLEGQPPYILGYEGAGVINHNRCNRFNVPYRSTDCFCGRSACER